MITLHEGAVEGTGDNSAGGGCRGQGITVQVGAVEGTGDTAEW